MPPCGPEREPRHLGQAYVGPDPDGRNDKVARNDSAVGQLDAPVGHLCHTDARLDNDTVVDHLRRDEHRELGVEGRQYLRGNLDHGGLDSQTRQVLGCLESDETGADDDGTVRFVVGLPGQQLRILDSAENADPVEAG